MGIRLPHFRRQHRIARSKRILAFAAAQDARLSVAALKAAGTLTMGTNPTNGQIVTIGSVVYTFQSALTEAAGNVKIGGSAAVSLTNLFNAINKVQGNSGTDYAAANVAHPDVTATNPTGTTLVATARVGGTANNSKATTTNVTAASWGNTTLVGGTAGNGYTTLGYLKRNSAESIAKAASIGVLK